MPYGDCGASERGSGAHLAKPNSAVDILPAARLDTLTWLKYNLNLIDVDNPTLRWAWILPKYAHGVLIEVRIATSWLTGC